MKPTDVTPAWLAEQLRTSGRKQNALAGYLKVGDSAISRILSGERQIKLHEAKGMLDFFGIEQTEGLTPDDLSDEILHADNISKSADHNDDNIDWLSIASALEYALKAAQSNPAKVTGIALAMLARDWYRRERKNKQ